MSEVEKMYKNAGVGYLMYVVDTFPPVEYPQIDFTAEKQLELIKWLCQNTYRNYIHIRYERDINNWKMECNMIGLREYGSFEECFAGLINNLWQDLTEEERKQIKEILE